MQRLNGGGTSLLHWHTWRWHGWAILVLLMTVTAPGKTWEGLVAYWPMDEASGTVVGDVTGRNIGTRDESTGWQAGGAPLLFANDASISFSSNGDSTGQVIRVPDSPSLDSIDVTGKFSIAFWYIPGNSWPQDYAFAGRTNLVFGQNNILGMQLVLDGGTVTTPNSVIAEGSWQHLAVTYDRAAATAVFYVNGAVVHTGSLSSTTLSSDEEWQIHGYLGFDNHNGNSNPAQYDDMRVYNRVLSQEEIQELTGGRGGEMQWGRNRQISLNTTFTGAGVDGDVTDFPVLVRLSSTNFNFADAATGGADIRFTKAGGIVHLPYEIERWTGTEAEIWVKVDTVHGNTNDQHVMMFYGNSAAADSSAPSQVFATSEGFMGVWHLNESVSDGTSGLADATGASGGDARPNKVAEGGGQTGVAAQIGNGVRLADGKGIIETHNVVPPGDMTISMWVQPTEINQGNDFLIMDRNCTDSTICLATYQEPWLAYGIRIAGSLHPLLQWSTDSVTHFVGAGRALYEDAWNHVMAEKKGDSLKIFLDGQLWGRKGFIEGSILSPDWGLKIGGENVESFQVPGYYDEVRVCSVARTPEWIRLSYMNQQADDSLVTVGSDICDNVAILSDPQDTTVEGGATVTFQVVAIGTGRSYQWFKDASPISGATGTIYSFTADVADNGSAYYCQVSGACGAPQSSLQATLHVLPPCQPIAFTVPLSDTAVRPNTSLTLTITVNDPSATFQWQLNGTDLAATSNSYVIDPVTGASVGEYSCIATNQCSVDTSRMTLALTDTTPPVPATALTLNSLGPTAINVLWDTPESSSPDADSVFVFYSTTAYQTPTSPSRQVVAAQPVTIAARTQDLDVSGLTADSRYYFTLWLKDTIGNWAYADSDTVSTRPEGVPVNPVVVRGQYVDSTHITLTLSNFCQLPSAQSPFSLWAEYIGVWYQAGTAPAQPDTSSSEMLTFPLPALKTAGCPGGSVDTTVTVPALNGGDSLYCFSVSVVWHVPDSIMPFVPANGDSVLMRDISPPTNALTIMGAYPGGRSDSATISLGNTASLEPKVTEVVVLCSFDSTFGDTISLASLDPATVAAAEPYQLVVRNSAFDGALQSVYCAVVLRSDQGASSNVVTSSFTVGRDIPVNPIVLTATGVSSYEVDLSWPSVAASGADSIRIFRDTVQIGQNLIDVTTPFQTLYLNGLAVSETVSGLNASTVYYFAAQAQIGGEWTAVSSASRDSAVTQEVDTTNIIPNTVTIDTAWFDSSTNSIVVTWHYPVTDSVFYGIIHGVDSTAVAGGTPSDWNRADSASYTSTIVLGTDILFDTTFYVVIKLRKGGGVPSSATPNASRSVWIPAYSWEPIVYFRQPTGDTVRAFNDHVFLWYEGGSWGFGEFDDTVRTYVPATSPSGFIPVSPGFSLSRFDDGPSVTVALRYDSVPSGYQAGDIRMYRLTPEGQWEVFHDYVYYDGQGMVGISTRLVRLVNQQLMLMVDTQRPTLVVPTYVSAPVEPGVSIFDSVRVSDNVGNAVVSVLYSRGENAPRVMSYDTMLTYTGSITSTIPGGYVTDDNGVRAYAVVTDGLHSDTVNISRQVNREQASDISSEAGAWVPLRSTAVLTDSTMAPVIAEAINGAGYDNTKCRVFRYFDPSSFDGSSAGGHSWVEYSPAAEPVFGIVPGRLMWVKTKNTHRMDFGSGVTTSLRDTTAIALPPQTWTDFALPHKFSICVGDIVDATGAAADNLQFYAWTRGADNVYVTDALYIASLPEPTLTDRASELDPGIRSGYSVYNPDAAPATLRIPPTTHLMSSYYSAQRAVPKAQADGTWALKLAGGTAEGGVLGTVVLGFVPDKGAASTWYPSAPGLGGVSARVCNPATRALHGHVVHHDLAHGGVTYRLAFVNESDEKHTVTFRLEGVEQLADSLDVRFVDPTFGSVQPAGEDMAISVPAKSISYRDVTVGGPSYYRTALVTVAPLSRLRVYPNPFRVAVTVQFGLPEGISRVRYQLYDARGRVVWQYSQRDKLRAGLNEVVWDGTVGQDKAASAGTYLLRVRAEQDDGKVLATKELQLIRLP